MPIWLLHTYNDLIARTVEVLGFSDGKVDGVALVMTMTYDSAVVVHHLPSVQRLVVIDMEGVIGASFSRPGH